MLSYLSEGWFCPSLPQRMRPEVLDGVLDSAGLLVRAGIDSDALLRLRRVLDQHGPAAAAKNLGNDGPSDTERRQMLLAHILSCTEGLPILQGFMMDCLEAAVDAPTFVALATHLTHIGQAMALLQNARRSRADGADYPQDAPMELSGRPHQPMSARS